MYAGTYVFSDVENAFTPKDLLPVVKAGVFPKEHATIANLRSIYKDGPDAWVGHVTDAAMYLTKDAGSALFAEMNRLHKDLAFTIKNSNTHAPELAKLVTVLRAIGKAFTPNKFQNSTFRMKALIYDDDKDGSAWGGELNRNKEYALGIHFGGSVRVRWNLFEHGVPIDSEAISMTLRHGSLFVFDKAALCGEWKRYSVPAYRRSMGTHLFHEALDRKMLSEWERRSKKRRGIKGAWVEQVKKKQKTLRECAVEDSENDQRMHNANTPPNTPLPGCTAPVIVDRICSPNYWSLPLEEQLDLSDPKHNYWKNMGEDLLEEWEAAPMEVKEYALTYQENSTFEEQVDQLLQEDMSSVIDEYF